MPKVLIVGGSSGIGLATAKTFANAKYDITIASRNAANLDLSRFHKVNLDFMDEAAVKAFFKAHSDFNYIVVTATTPLTMGPFLSVNLDEAKKTFGKFWGVVHVMRFAAQYSKHLKAITIVSGAAADRRGAPITFLATSCMAVNVLVESLAVELAPLRINAISPGLTHTPLYGDTSRETLQEWADASPLKRLATASEIAEAIVFMTLHHQITGAIVPVDGGARLV